MYLFKLIDRRMGRYTTSTICLLKIKHTISNFLGLQICIFFFSGNNHYWTSSTFCIQITRWVSLFCIYCHNLSAITNHNKYQIMLKQKSELKFVCSISWKCVQNHFGIAWCLILMHKLSLKYFYSYPISEVTITALCKHRDTQTSDNETTCIVH